MVSRRSTLLFYGIALGAAALDQVTKAAARVSLTEGIPVSLIPGFLRLDLVFNKGAAFGALPNWAPLFIVVALVAIYAIARLRKAGPQSFVLTLGLALLLSGALGNLIDRIVLPSHAVTDFLSICINDRPVWPTFNVADIAVVVGAALMFFYVYVLEKKQPEVV